MERSRLTDREFWVDSVHVPVAARLLYIGMQDFADDRGTLRDDPKWLKAIFFPGDEDITPDEVRKLVESLISEEAIGRFEDNGMTYLGINAWGDGHPITAQHPGQRSASEHSVKPSPTWPTPQESADPEYFRRRLDCPSRQAFGLGSASDSNEESHRGFPTFQQFIGLESADGQPTPVLALWEKYMPKPPSQQASWELLEAGQQWPLETIEKAFQEMMQHCKRPNWREVHNTLLVWQRQGTRLRA